MPPLDQRPGNSVVTLRCSDLAPGEILEGDLGIFHGDSVICAEACRILNDGIPDPRNFLTSAIRSIQEKGREACLVPVRDIDVRYFGPGYSDEGKPVSEVSPHAFVFLSKERR